MGSGKPRVAGNLLDRIVPERVAALNEDVPGVLTVVVATDVKDGREQATQYGTDTPGPYHCSELDAVLRLLKGDDHAARIIIPFATYCKMLYSDEMWTLLDKLGQPQVIFLIDEVTEVYKAAILGTKPFFCSVRSFLTTHTCADGKKERWR